NILTGCFFIGSEWRMGACPCAGWTPCCLNEALEIEEEIGLSEVKKGVYPLQRIWATVLLALVLVLQSVAGAGVAQAAESEGGSTVRAQVKEAIASLRTSLAKQQPVSDWAAFT